MLKKFKGVCILSLVFILASCGRTPSAVIGGSDSSASCKYVDVASLKQKISIDVPYVEQLPNYCGPASLEMVLRYYGTKTDQQQIGAGIVESNGVSASALEQVAIDMGYDATEEYCGLNNLLDSLSAGVPVLVRVINNTGTNGHFMVVTGYDLTQEILYINDPASPTNEKISFKDFDTIWNITTLASYNNSSRLMIIVVPDGS